MKRWICVALIALLAVPVGVRAETNWWSDIGPGAVEPEESLGYDDGEEGDVVPEYEGDEGDPGEGEWPDALFDPGVSEITSRSFGNAVDCAILGDWTIARGYFLDEYRITGERYGSPRQVMADASLVLDFVPAGDGIIYYGEATKGASSWLYKRPGDAAPYQLPLTDQQSVFCADEDGIWYFAWGKGTSRPISRMGYDGKNKKQVGKLNANVIGRMDDGSVVGALYSKNQVIRWENGKSAVIYDAKKRDITDVITTGRSIWVQHDDGFGLLENGALSFVLKGRIRAAGRTTDQLVFVVEPGGTADRDTVMVFNENYRAWTVAGEIQAQVNMSVELTPPSQFTVWGPEESGTFDLPAPDRWLPYGCFTSSEAEAAGFRPWQDAMRP